MAWNEPGGDKDPWSSNRGDSGATDLDQIVKGLRNRLGPIFGAGGGSGAFGIVLLAMLLVLAWLASGIYKVDASERGVVQRFGALHQITHPGLHWRIPYPVDTVNNVNVAQIDKFNYRTQMLTSDENIVQIDLAVQYRRAEATDYLFNVRDPDRTLADVSESAIREVVGKSKMDFILREGRADIAERTMVLMQQTLDSYQTGIVVTSVNLQDANFPDKVQDAVRDAIKAREDKERSTLEAQAYANGVVPQARGGAAAELERASAYRERVINDASGATSRFLQLLDEYEKAPQVTRDRLYLETMEDVYGNSRKVLLDAEGSGNLLYLPIDKLLESQPGARGVSTPRLQVPGAEAQRPANSSTDSRSRESLRSRGNN